MKADVSSSGPPLVELQGISKRYGDLLANDGIDLAIEPGEIHALLGENGAGKSTLVKILYGVIEPSAGEIRWEGRPVTIGSPVEARNLGLGMVFQHFSLFDELTVAENIAVALSNEWSLSTVRSKLGEISRTYGLALDADPRRVKKVKIHSGKIPRASRARESRKAAIAAAQRKSNEDALTPDAGAASDSSSHGSQQS